MTLKEENRNDIVNYRLHRAKETLAEAKGAFEMGFWHATANRLYYACFYAVHALLMKNGHLTRTHNGVFTLFGKYFVLNGIVSKEQNKLYGTLLELRQDGDYGDWVVIKEEDVKPLIEPVEIFIAEIENLIQNS